MKIFHILNKFQIKFLIIILISGYVNNTELYGPFLLWGNENLNDIKLSPALNDIDESILINIFSSSDIVLLFQKDKLLKLNNINFPCLNQLIKNNNNSWSFIQQYSLPDDLLEYASDIEIIHLNDSDTLKNDKFICETYKNHDNSIENGKILGILSNFPVTTKSDNSMKFKRSTTNNYHVKKSHPIIYSDENENVLLYTSSSPILTIILEYYIVEEKLEDITSIEFEGTVDNGNTFNLTVNYNVQKANDSVNLKFLFETNYGYWSISSVQIETNTFSNIFYINENDNKPIAPFGFSYWCGKSLSFIDENKNTLTMENIQVEAFLNKFENHTRFNDAYDCVGFMTVPIISGICVSFFLLCVTLIGIIAIMEIKTPSRFDTQKTKQLTIILSDQDLRN